MNDRTFTLGPRDPARSLPRRLALGLVRLPARLTRHVCAHWIAYVPVFIIWGLAFTRVFIDPTPHLPILFNWTPSLAYKVAVVRYGNLQPFKQGDYIIFAFDGDAQRIYPGLRAQTFFKKISGMPGDRITVVGRQVFVNGHGVGLAKANTFDGHPLAPIAEMVIPAGKFYVQGTSPDSFDSRYRASGLVRMDQVLGKVIPLF
ncbi:conjugative transfer signal peptidase TraF [Massilia sp. CMS3.1]|uniref:conjugative transfer signal peptidase TraF n=1 Tax=Massilia sp. CMS3.1 TaxID=3373083 RepID=UPI003EE6A1AA